MGEKGEGLPDIGKRRTVRSISGYLRYRSTDMRHGMGGQLPDNNSTDP